MFKQKTIPMASAPPSDVASMQSFIASKMESMDPAEIQRLTEVDNEPVDTSTLTPQTDLKRKCRMKFKKGIEQFIRSCLNPIMFPGDKAMLAFQAKYTSKTTIEGEVALHEWLDELLRAFDKAFGECAADIDRDNIDATFRKLDGASAHMAAFALGAKLCTMTPPQKKTLWKYVKAFRELGRSYRLFIELTDPIMNVIRQETQRIITSFQTTNEVDWDMLNPLNLGVRVLAASPKEDKDNIVKRIQSGKLSMVLLLQLMLEELKRNKIPIDAVTSGHTGKMDPVTAEAMLRSNKNGRK